MNTSAVEVRLHSFLLSKLDWRYVANFTSRQVYPLKRTPKPIKRKGGWALKTL